MNILFLAGRALPLSLGICFSALALTACGGSKPAEQPTTTPPTTVPVDPGSNAGTIDIRADVNRDGFVNAMDDEDAEQVSAGVIVLPNIDDDGDRCKAFKTFDRGLLIATDTFVNCNDAADEVSNGADDIADLTLVKLSEWSDAPDAERIEIHVTDSAAKETFRILIRRGDSYTSIENSPLTINDIRAGAELAIESKDIIRDASVWDGSTLLRVELHVNNTVMFDELPLQLAPIITQHELGNVTSLFVAPSLGEPFDNRGNGYDPLLSREDQAKLDSIAPEAVYPKFVEDLTQASSDIVNNIVSMNDTFGDIWVQDLFEPAFAARPTEQGAQIIRVLIRSAAISRSGPDFYSAPQFQDMSIEQIDNYLDSLSDAEFDDLAESINPGYKNAFREGGIALYSELRGPGVGVVQIKRQYLSADEGAAGFEDTFNSTGNFTTAPPHVTSRQSYPLGRMIYGAKPNSRFIQLLESQGVQHPLSIPTEWLIVGHVDEFISFLPSNNARGWVMAVADPDAAYAVLRNAQDQTGGNNKVFEGLFKERGAGPDNTQGTQGIESLETSLSNLLNDKDLRAANDFAIGYIEQALAILTDELELKDEDIVRIPVLFKTAEGASERDPNRLTPTDAIRSKAVVAYFPDAVNGVYIGDKVFVSPMQHGPKVNEEDALQVATEAILKPHGITVRWVDDLHYAHLGEGEIHCVTNTYRDITDVTTWWE